jgi:hypothetical protein
VDEIETTDERYTKTLRLKFKHKKQSRNSVGLQPIENKCVVSGKTENLTVHHVIPSCIRMNFPKKLKEHNHTWCVPLADNEHDRADQFALEIHGKFLKDLNNEISDWVTKKRKREIRKFIKAHGGPEKMAQLYKKKFLKMEPKFLPEGFLKDME